MQSDFPINEIQRLPERLERGNPEMQQFLDVLIHDVRAAQRGINTSADLLRVQLDGHLDPDIRQILQQLQNGVARMNVILVGVSDYASSLPTARYSFGLIPMEIPLRLALSSLDAQMRQTNAIITHGTLPQVRGDPERLSCLFRNLIANALTYRGSNGSRIDIQARTDSDHYVFSVRDDGIGIPQKYWDGLFLPFSRLHGSEFPGAGLGLATCKNIVDAHGGKIWIDSEVEQFTTIFFTLPAK